ncbi:HIG1 domain-containing protein [Gimibacter soli]|uniref:HIG1 domain-containing protein n=1 Tax=Gimibacter soli TaxID=3024400 RepID=A0AAE9XRH2_9PROT|nr:HIG1 domain-containing protein [Gimibacter soli]WCL54971.1 HIG1 domain-containing protein [Gimibacter soli]
MKFLIILALIFALITLGILIFGVTAMAKGGDFNKKYGNKLMQARVASQGITILLLFIVALMASAG